MKKKLQSTMAAIALTAITQVTFAAESSRTLVPLADPLDQIQGNIKQARDRTAKDLEEARKALRVDAPDLSEMLENLAEETKRLEQETTKLSDVDAQPVMLCLHVCARGGINEVQNRL